jgi:hypothetical protein
MNVQYTHTHTHTFYLGLSGLPLCHEALAACKSSLATVIHELQSRRTIRIHPSEVPHVQTSACSGGEHVGPEWRGCRRLVRA